MQRGRTDRLFDIAVTLLCWMYFILGFLVFFSPLYIAAALFSSQREHAFQRLNRTFYRGFFAFLRTLAPPQQWIIDERIADLRSAVIVCNHRSYLDPLLLIALLDRSKTFVKSIFFTVPIFSWVLRTAGYLPASSATGRFVGLMLAQMETMGAYLASGGNLFIFPEGTRSRDDNLGTLSQGALKIARQCQVPVYVLCLHNTDRLFPPGCFFFCTRKPNVISVRVVDHILAGDRHQGLADLHDRVRQALEHCLQDAAILPTSRRSLPSRSNCTTGGL